MAKYFHCFIPPCSLTKRDTRLDLSHENSLQSFPSESVQQQMCEVQCNICSKIVAHAAEIFASCHFLAKENCTIHQKYKTNLNLRFNYTADIQKYELLFVFRISNYSNTTLDITSLDHNNKHQQRT